MKLKGLFVEEIDFDDPSYAPWNIQKLGKWNEAQRNAYLDDDDDIDILPLTEAERVELCLKMQCRVELGRSNVCKGVERGWPKRMFKKPTFNDLEPKEKRCINRTMIRKAVQLYNKYVDEDRLKQRCRRRTRNALAPFWEKRYRKHIFERLKAMAEPGDEHDELSIDELNANDELIDDGKFNGDMTDDDSDNDRLVIDEQYASKLHDESTENSMVTVINSGSVQCEELATKNTNSKEASQVDFYDNNYDMDDGDVDSDHFTLKKIPRRTALNKRQPLNAKNNISLQQGFIPEDNKLVNIGIQNEHNNSRDDEFDNIGIRNEHNSRDICYNDIFSESFVTSTVPNDDVERPTQDFMMTPNMESLRNSIEDDELQYEEDLDVDSFDFLSQNMLTVQTSTQN